MFRGSLPAPVLSLVTENVGKWNCDDVYVGCSGNFTIERTVMALDRFRLHGNDVTLYSCAIGRYFAGDPLGFEFNDEYQDDYGYMKAYMGSDADKLATLLLMSHFTETVGKSNPYYDRIKGAYRDQWPELHAKTKQKILNLKMKLTSFTAGDVCEWVKTIPLDAGVICYPPFFTGDYENMFAKLEKVFRWTPPVYELINKDRIYELFREMMRRKYWMFGTNDRIEEFEKYLVGMSRTTNRGVPLYIYANSGQPRICVPNQTVEPVNIPRLGPGMEIGNKLGITILTAGQFASLRSQYMNVNIKPGQASLAIGVLVDDKLVGVYAFSAAPTMAKWDAYLEGPHIYLLSDFPVAPTDYPRLAKLVLYAALSKESKLLAERITGKRVASVTTTAFTKRPVSMKYRGLFDLLNRKEKKQDSTGNPEENYYKQGYELNYGSVMGRWTLQEGFAEWKAKHGAKGKGSENE